MDANLARHATPRQLEILEALDKCNGSKRGAGKLLGIDPKTIRESLERLQRKAAKGDAPTAPQAITPKAAAGHGKRILVLPDVQAKPGNDFSFLRRIGQYALDKRPDRIVCGGDLADMSSLSSYDRGKKAFEGRRYKRDIEAAQYAMNAFLGPIREYNEANPNARYLPELDLLYGNHEERILRATNEDAKLDGALSLKDLGYEEFGWRVHKFLEVVVIEGVAFSHYFTSGVMGRPVTTAQALLSKKHQSCIAFHQQGLQIATGYRADGTLLTAVICGSCYEGDEEYLGPQGNKHWRGFLMMHAVKDGAYDLMPVSLEYINRKYPHIKVEQPVYSMPTASEIAAGRM
jgi:hypothetical protein